MDAADVALRNRTYAAVVALGRAPAASELGVAEDEVLAGWRRLHDAHALVLQPDGRSLRMANPFSAVPTPFRVETTRGAYWGNCIWDALGIPAALGSDARITAACPDCGDALAVTVENDALAEASGVVHFAIPAARWWDDIIFT